MANKMETREKIPKQRTTNDRKTMGRRDLSEMKRTNERSQAQTCTHAEKIGHYLLFYSWFGDARACACKQSCKQSTGNMSLENAKQSHGKKNSFFRAVVVISVAALYFSLFFTHLIILPFIFGAFPFSFVSLILYPVAQCVCLSFNGSMIVANAYKFNTRSNGSNLENWSWKLLLMLQHISFALHSGGELNYC